MLETLTFTPSISGPLQFSFQDNGTNNIGAILDDIRVDAVPLPALGWLLLSALGALGVFGRKRAARHARPNERRARADRGGGASTGRERRKFGA